MSATTEFRVVATELFFLPVVTRVPLKFGSETVTSVTCARVRVMIDTKGCAKLLGVSPDMVDRLRLKAGLPAVDLGFQRPGRRAKHLWRFDPVEVRAWWRRKALNQSDDELELPTETAKHERRHGAATTSDRE